MFDFIQKFKNTRLYWKYRHFIQKDTWSTYYNDFSKDRRNFYTYLVNKYKCNTVFEFGCASGPNLKNIDLGSNHRVFLYGYDISKSAIKFANDHLTSKTFFFSFKLSEKQIKFKLTEWGYQSFDMAIYDRVLCCMNEKNVYDHFSKFSKYFNLVVIDDFHNEKSNENNGKYSAKNFKAILFNFDFQLISEEDSGHILSEDIFFKRNAKRMIFQKKLV